jgi:hypothetical protein
LNGVHLRIDGAIKMSNMWFKNWISKIFKETRLIIY